jgi:hypothetical protein
MPIIDPTTQNALANESRMQALRIKIAKLQGGMDASSLAMDKLSMINSDAAIQLTSLQQQLVTLESGSGPGISSNYGLKGTVTQMLEAERVAGLSAVIDLVVATPSTVRADAITAWNTAALASHPTVITVIQDGAPMLAYFSAAQFAAGIITADSFQKLRDWLIATPKANAILYMQ